jgi:hypothetical protein
MPYGKRSQDGKAWHYCARCTRKWKLATDLRWQRGKLLCIEYCYDQRLVGGREIIINQVLTDSKANEELAPPPKLRNPESFDPVDDLLI